MSPRTKQNLNSALLTDAFTHAKYLRFAAHARMKGNWNVAQIFQVAADTARTEQFSKEADFAGLIADDSDNLRIAMAEKRAEAGTYAQFAEEATADGDLVAAAHFDDMQRSAEKQEKTFEAAFLMQARESTATLVEV